MARRTRILNGLVLAALLVLGPAGVLAESTDAGHDDFDQEALEQENQRSDSEESGGGSYQSGGSSATASKSKLEVHGFLTQAYADGSFLEGRFPGPGGVPQGPTFDERAIGIPEDGTFNYRAMALQFRYEMTPQDIFVVQLSSRALGDSPISNVEDEVELDWAFYERRLGDDTAVKLGRVQIPFGIFNELRDVGTILPFYRAPFLFYREGAFTSETVDGIVLSHIFGAASDWSFETDFFVGRWDSIEQDPIGTAGVAKANNEGYGFQFWLNTPVSGLRFGLGGHHRDVTEGAEGVLRLPGATSKLDDFYFSVEAAFERIVFRAEYREFEGDPETSPAFGATDFSSTINQVYGQLGYHPTDKLRFYVQYETGDSDIFASIFTNDFTVTLREDLGFAVNYLFSPNLVLKAEYHEVSGEDFTFFPTVGPAGFQLVPLVTDLDDGNYYILSFSVSF